MVIETWEEQLLSLYRILRGAPERTDRTGTGTRSKFSHQIRVDLEKGFPLVTTKYVNIKSVIAELLWFLEGSSDERRLAEILHGTRDPEKKTIWTQNAEATTGSSYQPQYPGDLGRVYGVQWRTWARPDGTHVDQIAECVKKLKSNPTDRAIMFTALNVGELDQMMIRPCHLFCQFYMTNNNRLDAKVYIRSWDTFLGAPYNIASYAVLAHMMAHVVGAVPGVLTIDSGDTHLYLNHIEQVNEQLLRVPYDPPTLRIDRIGNIGIDSFCLTDFSIENYQHHDAIKAPMSQ